MYACVYICTFFLVPTERIWIQFFFHNKSSTLGRVLNPKLINVLCVDCFILQGHEKTKGYICYAVNYSNLKNNRLTTYENKHKYLENWRFI